MPPTDDQSGVGAPKPRSAGEKPAPGQPERRRALKRLVRGLAGPSRRDRILANLDLKALQGVEIGALASPLVRPEQGDILYVDFADTATLREKYKDDPTVAIADIVNVDALWGSQTLQQCIGADRKVDYVVASHVIEHVPDLIAWLAEIRAILKPAGALRLAIPDRRYTFDFLRPESRLHDVLDAYLSRARAPLPRAILEVNNLARAVDCGDAWDGALDIDNLRRLGNPKVGIEQARDALANGTYYDTHCWVFTPLSFAELCAEMAQSDLLDLACDFYVETPRNQLEFYVGMVPGADKAAVIASWRTMRASLLASRTYQKVPPNALRRVASRLLLRNLRRRVWAAAVRARERMRG